MNLTDLKKQPIADLLTMSQEMGLENLSRTRKQDIIFAILKKHAKNGEDEDAKQKKGNQRRNPRERQFQLRLVLHDFLSLRPFFSLRAFALNF